MKNNSMFWSVLKSFFTKKQEYKYVKNNRSITFEYSGRSGYIIYKNANKKAQFYTEVGGGDCIFYIVIPSKEDWEKQTKLALNEREEIIRYIAEESLLKQAILPESYYKIEDTHIVFYQK